MITVHVGDSMLTLIKQPLCFLGKVVTYPSMTTFYGHDLLKVSESVSYLGLTLSSRGKFLLTQRNLADRNEMNRALGHFCAHIG